MDWLKWLEGRLEVDGVQGRAHDIGIDTALCQKKMTTAANNTPECNSEFLDQMAR
jgi:hypothetical protein